MTSEWASTRPCTAYAARFLDVWLDLDRGRQCAFVEAREALRVHGVIRGEARQNQNYEREK